MPEFSACYFCGTALDAPLAEYPVIPDALHPSADEQRTVVLCPTCRRKLGAVVDTVIEAVDDAPGEESIQQDLTEANDRGASAAADAVNAAEGGTAVDDASDSGFEFAGDASTSGAEVETGDQSTSGAGADERATDETVRDRPATEGAATDGPATEGSVTDGPATDETAAKESDTGDVTTNDPLEETGKTESDRGDAAPAADTAGGTKAGETSHEGNGATEASDESDDEPELTALEYNKVMRLLQNREFPVDHEEFKVVATNAYDISDDEFDSILEAAEKRDLIGLESGQIVDS